MNDHNKDETKIVDEKVDYMMVEEGPGQEITNFTTPKAQQEKTLSGASGSAAVEAPNPPTPKSEWPNGARKSIEVNGRAWEYVEYGNPNGEPVLNVHGWLGSSAEGNARLARALTGEVLESQGLQNLDKPREESLDKTQPHGGAPKGAEKVRQITESLKGKYNVIVPELPGFGKTPELDVPTVDKMADELADFYRALGKKPAVAFGSSAGAILVTKMAARNPELVNTLVLQGLMTKPSDMEKVPYWAARVVTFKPIARALEMFPQFATERLFPMMVSGGKDFNNADAAIQKLILDSAKEGHVPTMMDTLRDIGKNIEDDIAQVKAPVVVLDGASGDLVPIAKSKENVGKFHPEEGSNLQEKIGERKVLYFQAGGAAGEHTHNVINTAPEEVAVLMNSAVEFFRKSGSIGGKEFTSPQAVEGALPEERTDAHTQTIRNQLDQQNKTIEQSRLAKVRQSLARFVRMGR